MEIKLKMKLNVKITIQDRTRRKGTSLTMKTNLRTSRCALSVLLCVDELCWVVCCGECCCVLLHLFTAFLAAKNEK